jgi:heat shock protein HslJ
MQRCTKTIATQHAFLHCEADRCCAGAATKVYSRLLIITPRSFIPVGDTMQPLTRWRAALSAALGAAILTGFVPAACAQSDFPFGRELLLDAPPMKGSKRVPSLDIAENGTADIDLWCNTLKGQMVVAGDTITILTGAKTERACSPERQRGDEEVLAALTEATNWRFEGEVLTLIGPRPLRFRVPTN